MQNCGRTSQIPSLQPVSKTTSAGDNINGIQYNILKFASSNKGFAKLYLEIQFFFIALQVQMHISIREHTLMQ